MKRLFGHVSIEAKHIRIVESLNRRDRYQNFIQLLIWELNIDMFMNNKCMKRMVVYPPTGWHHVR